ncbi:MAG: rRNA (adenine1518-N6/adenine1519-N6)-dimethyltransferase [Acidimicrobiaceae bacterium]|jgi:16S rRNA (adenine1518-N6/adenine1519-N6)-dimethyltransferase|nr:rRNA (adenine1518-N6/adenine1519-N6)-dimethyltransferase [Acidimicrobiaceae bacterium]MDQ1427709.1 rRNA (adenine1518-N6/adenine1519-N6)-dimethyltransferase [Acidimicrobiaceae bacterium]
MTLTRRQTIELLETHGLRPSRALGQNFVADPNTVRRIARLAEVGAGDQVLEIGAGLGSLTLALAETGARVTAVELDRHLLPALRDNAEPAGVEVVEGDAMTLDWAQLLGPVANSWTLVANLPYNIATPLVADLLDEVPAIGRMLVMVQREVGERLAAPAGADAYGAVSVKVAYWATAKVTGRVPASVFIPRPAVESVLVDIRRRSQPAVDPAVVPARELFELVRAGFGHRRKMLRKSLEGLVGPQHFECAQIAPTARAEELDIAAWGRLAACRRRLSGS